MGDVVLHRLADRMTLRSAYVGRARSVKVAAHAPFWNTNRSSRSRYRRGDHSVDVAHDPLRCTRCELSGPLSSRCRWCHGAAQRRRALGDRRALLNRSRGQIGDAEWEIAFRVMRRCRMALVDSTSLSRSRSAARSCLKGSTHFGGHRVRWCRWVPREREPCEQARGRAVRDTDDPSVGYRPPLVAPQQRRLGGYWPAAQHCASRGGRRSRCSDRSRHGRSRRMTPRNS